MRLDQIDQLLAEWMARLARIDDNLVGLETGVTFSLLEEAGEAGLDGETRTTIGPALAAVRELFADRSLLDELVARARSLREALGRRPTPAALAEIEHLLRGPSITLPEVETPAAERGLLDAEATAASITPDQLVDRMIASFSSTRDAVNAVDDAWSRLPRSLDDAGATVARLMGQATALGTDAASLAPVRAAIERARSTLARDPLGAAQAFASEVTVPIEGIVRSVAAAEQDRAAVDAELKEAARTLDELADLHSRAAAAAGLVAAQIADPPVVATLVDGGRIDQLRRSLADLQGRLAGGGWVGVQDGVADWLRLAGTVRDEELAAEASRLAPVAERDELRGRLEARRQQARALAGRGRPIDPGLEALGAEAAGVLAEVPTPLGRAVELVGEFEARFQASR